jgi:hypothetical protein
MNGSALPFKTFSLSPNRELRLCYSHPDRDGHGRLLVLDVRGNVQRTIDLDFVPTTINFHQETDRSIIAFLAARERLPWLSFELQ